MAPVFEPPPLPDSDGGAEPVADEPAAVPEPVVDELDVEDVVEVDPDDVDVDVDEDEVEELVVVAELVEEVWKFTNAVLTI